MPAHVRLEIENQLIHFRWHKFSTIEADGPRILRLVRGELLHREIACPPRSPWTGGVVFGTSSVERMWNRAGSKFDTTRDYSRERSRGWRLAWQFIKQDRLQTCEREPAI